MTAACAVFLIDFTVSTCSKTHEKLNRYDNKNTCSSHVENKKCLEKGCSQLG
jgi:hypothetical protein